MLDISEALNYVPDYTVAYILLILSILFGIISLLIWNKERKFYDKIFKKRSK